MSVAVTYKPWDAHFFGFKTGDLSFTGTATALITALQQLKYDGYQLLYWKISDTNQENINIAEQLHLFKGDIKVLYTFNVDELINEPKQQIEIKLWDGSISDGLIELGIESGRYSRFKKDPVFPSGSFERMYTEWVKQSLDGTMGDEIYYIGEPANIKAFITIAYHQTHAEIGLIAVDENFRKQGYGTAMTIFAKNKTKQHNLPALLVATQHQNKEACLLYEKCHAKIISIEHIYHIHL